MTEDQIITAICNSQKLEDTGPPVVGKIEGESFTLTGVIRHGLANPQTIVCIASKDRKRLLSVTHWKQHQRLGRWSQGDFKTYSGFYIPLKWLNAVEVIE